MCEVSFKCLECFIANVVLHTACIFISSFRANTDTNKQFREHNMATINSARFGQTFIGENNIAIMLNLDLRLMCFKFLRISESF